jgi:hypothetical protein
MIRLPIRSVDAVVVHGDGRAERISRRIDFWQAYRRGSVMMWTCSARSDLRLV